ncbi:MAG: hypothetical protein HQ591_02140 [candidate division Zixibacteria bacterium]|nr:hypothetical protein [Candidatus Tariuqbacter arcticus]
MLKKIFPIALILTFLLFLTLPPAYSQVAYQPVGLVGGIDYGNRVVVAKGMGIPGGIGGRGGQIRAAIMDAQRNYLEVAKGAYVTSSSTVEAGMLTGDVIQSKVEGLVRDFTVVDTSYWDDGTIEVTLEFGMSGKFLDAVLPKEIGEASPPSYTPSPTIITQPPLVPSQPPAVPSHPQPTPVPTGLVVDGRGLGVRPALAPKIVDERGEEVYGSSYVSREYAIQQGMVGYAKDPDKASSDDRVAPTPIQVKGIKAEGPNRSDLVISNQDAARLLSLSESLNFLRQCKVIILVD